MNTGILNPKKKIDSRFDVLKFILAVMIIAIHTYLYPHILMPWLRIAVPLFFIMSSYFFFKKLHCITDTKQANKILCGFVKRSALLYLFWFIVNLPITITIRGYFSAGIFNGICSIVDNALFDSTFVASWFIAANIIGTCLIFALRKYPKTALTISLLMFALCCLYTGWHFALPDFSHWLTDTLHRWYFFFSFPAAMIWIWMGMIMAQKRVASSQRLWLTMILIGAIALYLEYKYTKASGYIEWDDCFFSLLIICPAIFMYVKSLAPRYFPFSLSLRRASIIFYCTHGSIASLIERYYLQHQIHEWWAGPIAFGITLAWCILVSLLILSLSRHKYFKWLRYSY